MEEFVLKTNRYVVAFAGVMFHLMIGSVYAWSVLLIQLQNKMVGQNPQLLLHLVSLFSSWECQPPLWAKSLKK